MAVKAIDDSVSIDGLVWRLLIFGALHRLGLPTVRPAPSTFQHAAGLKKATWSMSKHFAIRQIRAALNLRNGHDVGVIHKDPIGSPAHVYRKTTASCWQQVVKPYLLPTTSCSFAFSRLSVQTIKRLMDRSVFTVVSASEVEAYRVYGFQLVDTVKNDGKPEAYKTSRLVVKAYSDSGNGCLTSALTVKRVSELIFLSFYATDSSLHFFNAMLLRITYNLRTHQNETALYTGR